MWSWQLAWMSSWWACFMVSVETYKAKNKTSPAQEGRDFHPLPACAERRKRNTALSSLPRALCPAPQQQVPVSQASMPQILKLHLVVAPCPHPPGLGSHPC